MSEFTQYSKSTRLHTLGRLVSIHLVKGGWTRLLQILNPYAVATPAPAPAWPSGCLAHLPEELMGNLLS